MNAFYASSAGIAVISTWRYCGVFVRRERRSWIAIKIAPPTSSRGVWSLLPRTPPARSLPSIAAELVAAVGIAMRHVANYLARFTISARLRPRSIAVLSSYMKLERIYLATVTMPSPGDAVAPDSLAGSYADNAFAAANPDFGTDSPMRLQITRAGRPVVSKVFSTSGGRLDHSDADLLEFDVASANLDVDPHNPRLSGALEILGNDRWTPLSIFVFGRSGSTAFPIGFAAVPGQMSTDSREGARSISLVAPLIGDDSTPVVKLLMITRTANVDGAGTDDQLSLSWRFDGTKVSSIKVPQNTFEVDLERGRTNIYPLPWVGGTLAGFLAFLGTSSLSPDAIFTRGRLDELKLITDGSDAWAPGSIFVFGIGALLQIVPLVVIPSWTRGWISRDPSDGSNASRPAHRSVSLPVVHG